MMKNETPKQLRGRAGYTLVEILIAMVVLMISFLAIIAAETSSLQGYISSRDSAEATELGRRIVELMQAEGHAWAQQPNQPFAPPVGPFTTSPFDATPRPLFTVAATPWAWHQLFANPVNVNLASVTTNPDLTGGRFCAWVRGGPLNTATTPLQALQVQVAVVYAGPFGDLPNCAAVTVASLDNGSDAYPGESLEETGLRVAYTATVVTPR